MIVALQENVKLSLRHAITLHLKSLKARVLEIFFGAIALALGENTEHQVDLTVKGRQLARNLHDNLLLELFVVDHVCDNFLEEILIGSLLKRHDVDTHLQLADLSLGVDCLNRVSLMDGTACNELRKGNLTHAYHVVGFSFRVRVERDTCDGGIVVEENDIQVLFLKVLDGLGVNKDLIRVGIVPAWVHTDGICGIPVIECVELVEEEGRDIGHIRVAHLKVLGAHDGNSHKLLLGLN